MSQYPKWVLTAGERRAFDAGLAVAGSPADNDLRAFVRESNRIEGILRDPTEAEVAAHERFLALDAVTVADMEAFVTDVAARPLRRAAGQNVRVGAHLPPPGGPHIERALDALLVAVHNDEDTPFALHVEYEKLHPFLDGNGRSGRVLWAWQMRRVGWDPFALPFLHRWYYQSLDEDHAASPADERLREAAAQAVFACLPVLHIVGSQNRGYAVCRDIDTQVTADPEEWANAAHAVCELHTALAGVSAEATPDGTTPTFCSRPDCGLRATGIAPDPDGVRWRPYCSDCMPAAEVRAAEAAPDDGWTPTSDNPSPVEWECELCGGRLAGPGERCGSAQHGPAGSVIYGRAVPVGGPIPDAEFGVYTPPPNPYQRDGATFAGSPEAIAYDRGFAAGLAARDTPDGER